MTFNVPDGEHAKNVARLSGDMGLVVGDIDRDEDGTCKNSNSKEKPAEKAKEAEENDRIESDLVKEVRFSRVNEWWNPGEKTIRNWRRLFVANMVFNFRLVYHLGEYKDRRIARTKANRPYYEDGGH